MAFVMTSRTWRVAGAVLALVLVLAAGGVLLVRRTRKPAPKPAPVPLAAPAEFVLSGPVQPRNTLAVAAPIQGVLESWFVEPGQEVYQDQLLGKIRSPELESAAQQAQFDLDQTGARIAMQNGEQLAAKLEQSRAEAEQSRAHNEVDQTEKAYNRQKGLWDAGATPRLAFEKAEKDYKDAKAALDRSDAAAKRATDHVESVGRDLDAANRAVAEKTQALERAKAALTSGDVHSPADGVVLARKVNAGDPVDPAIKDLVQIATELTSWQVILPAAASLRAGLHRGQSVTVHLSEDDFPGTVRDVSDAGVVVDFTSKNPIAKLDLTAQVKIK